MMLKSSVVTDKKGPLGPKQISVAKNNMKSLYPLSDMPWYELIPLIRWIKNTCCGGKELNMNSILNRVKNVVQWSDDEDDSINVDAKGKGNLNKS
jgi:hypothetical protein